ncbi:CRTAC1 family protein [Rhodohalobacter sp. SW132]|uniref:CRTAC1 family protein n=1 Tax=Rhodohalobacter sp. SW132 TaxID=2293433 RepID=UPI000E273421|nr:CRTAC1 family protein [Rhodohalobacter sp. SW132]REL38042.1 CRTAC1 family protein [Rhodohalobacter sp. SW132]
MEKSTIIRIGVIAFFLALFAVPTVLKQLDNVDLDQMFDDRQEVIDRYGFFLEEASEELGVQFVHQRPELDKKIEHINPQIASVGASVSVVDFNNNGLPDLYFTNSEYGTKNALYMNLGDGTFRDVAEDLGIADINTDGTGVSMGAIWGDINNNGYEDLFVYKWGRPELYLNNEGTGFTRVTESAGLPDWVNANSAVWLDYNNNGLLDLFVAGYYHEDVDFWNLTTTRIMPDSYEYATNGGRNFLFENQGDGTFVDKTEELGLNTRRWTLAVAAADLNDSGYPDLVIANDYGVDELFINDGGNGFINAGESAGMGFVPKSGMSVAFGDIMNQGQLAIYVTNISEAGVLMQGNNLWVPTRRSTPEQLRFRNLAGNMGVDIGEWGYGGQFIDLNNNGNLDLYVANGFVSDEPGTDYWYDYAKVVGGNRNVIIDANNWPAMNGRTFSGYQTNKIWMNDGAGRFREVSAAVGGTLDLDSRAIAYADLDQNGSLDLIVANQNGPVKIYRNHQSGSNNWLGLKLEGTKSNRSAIGAVAILHWDGKQKKMVVSGGDAFSSQSQRSLHFGLGGHDEVDRIEIRWPSGETQEIHSPEINLVHTITEPVDA